MAIVRLDKVAGQHLESIKHTAEMTNGLFVQLGGLVAGESELREVKVPTADSIKTGEFLLHASVELDADPRKAGLKHFTVAAGEAGRAYHLVSGDIITLTADLFASEPEVKDIVVPQVGSLKLDVADGTEETRLKAEVIQETVLGFDASKAYVIQIIQA